MKSPFLNTKEIAALWNRLQQRAPLVHSMMNYVAITDCANILLAAGASPIMAEAKEEAASVAGACDALVLNLGMLTLERKEAMLLAAEKAAERGIPILVDPVGVGVSPFRSEFAKRLLTEFPCSALRGNLSELALLSGQNLGVKGVDGERNADLTLRRHIAKQAAAKYHCVAALTGPVDVITDGCHSLQVKNGHSMLTKLTGTGCMTTALMGAALAVESNTLKAAAIAVSLMGVAGEMAYEMAGTQGAGSFHQALFDAVSLLTGECLAERMKWDEVED